MVSIYFAFGAVFNCFENGNRKLKLKLIPARSHTFFRALKRLPDSTLNSHWLMLMLTFLLIDSCEYFGFSQEPSTWSLQPPYWTYVTASSQNGLFLDYLFAGNRLHELTWVIRSMKREEKKWRPCAGTSSYQNYANSAFLLQYSSIPILPFLIYPTILRKFFHTCEKNSQERGLSFSFYLFICLIFVCIEGHPSSDPGPSKKNFMKRNQIQDDEEAECQR